MAPAMTRGGVPAAAALNARKPRGMTATPVSGATIAAMAATAGVRATRTAHRRAAGPVPQVLVVAGLGAVGSEATAAAGAFVVAALMTTARRRANLPGLTCSRADRSGRRELRSRATTGKQTARAAGTGAAGSARL